MEHRSSSEHINTRFVVLVSLIAATGGFLFGYDLAVVSGAIIFLKKQFVLSPVQVGFAIGSAQIGCILAPFAAGPISDRWGRKQSLFAAALLFAIAAIGTALPRNMTEFNAFRILAGVAIGLASVVSPMYIAEISPAQIRGRLVSLNQFAIVIGAMSSYGVSYYFSFSGNWRAMFACAAIPSLVLMIGLIFIPPSPRWLAQKNRFDEAFNVLARIEGPARAETEISAIRETVSAEIGTFSELLHHGIRIALLVGVTLCFLQGWSGGTAVNFYAPLIFQKAGSLGASQAILQTFLLNVSSLVFTVVALFLVDIAGRKPLLLIGSAGMAVTQFILGLFLYKGMPGLYTVVTVFVFNMFYQISIAPLAWLILSEIFPTRLRAKGQSVGTLAVWVSTYLSNQFLGPLMSYFEHQFGSVGPAFWVFALVCVFTFIFGWKMVPETKKRTLEEIAEWWLRQERVTRGVA
jgi:SP family arabinose:H+ symporter-like MFS transporter